MNTASFDVNAFNEHVATIGKKLTENFKQNVYRSKFPVKKNTFVIYDTKRYEILEEIENVNNKILLVMMGCVVKWLNFCSGAG